MKRIILVLTIAFLLAGCREKKSMASRSAAAFREAQKQGQTFTGAEHGHGAVSPAESPHAAEVDHAAMGHTTAESPDHAAMGHAGEMAGVDHARMGHAAATGPPAHPGHAAAPVQHAGHAMTPQAQQPQPGHAGHVTTSQPQAQPAPTDAHAGHTMTTQPAAPPALSAQAVRGQAGSTLQTDPLDAPAATSVSDANRARAMADEMATGGHAMHGTTRYQQVDAGRAAGQPQQQHQHTPPKEQP